MSIIPPTDPSSRSQQPFQPGEKKQDSGWLTKLFKAVTFTSGTSPVKRGPPSIKPPPAPTDKEIKAKELLSTIKKIDFFSASTKVLNDYRNKLETAKESINREGFPILNADLREQIDRIKNALPEVEE